MLKAQFHVTHFPCKFEGFSLEKYLHSNFLHSEHHALGLELHIEKKDMV